MNIKKIMKRILCLILILLLCTIMKECGQSKGTFVPLELWFEEKSSDESIAYLVRSM